MKMRHLSVMVWTAALVWGLFCLPAVAASGDAPPLHERVNALYARSQKMVEHGRHGHTGEMVDHAKAVVRDCDALIGWMETQKQVGQDGAVKKVPERQAITQMKMELIAARESAAESAKAGEAGQKRNALLAARKAFFQIKRARQQMEKIDE